MDGTLGSHTAWMLDGSGEQLLSEDGLAAAISEAAASGLSVAAHAIGDGANRAALNAFERTADAWQQAKQPDEARQAYEQFLSFFPGSTLAPTVEFRLGLLAFDSKDYARAAVAFTRALDDTAAGEMRSAARYNLALCHRQLGDPEAARAELERHREEFPADGRAADVAYQLGDLNETAGHVPEAIADYERSLAAHPRPALQSEVAYRLGKAHEQLGHEDAALHAYREAATAGTRTDTYRLSAVARVAALYEKRKDYPRAVAAYRDIAQNATDRELAAAAADRASQLAGSAKR